LKKRSKKLFRLRWHHGGRWLDKTRACTREEAKVFWSFFAKKDGLLPTLVGKQYS
jgi:hypothetical protein